MIYNSSVYIFLSLSYTQWNKKCHSFFDDWAQWTMSLINFDENNNLTTVITDNPPFGL